MKHRSIFILTIVLSIIFSSCTTEKTFKKDQESYLASVYYFKQSIELATDALESSETNNKQNDNDRQQLGEQVFLLIRNGISESKNVSDNYLDFVHPELKELYKNNCVESFKSGLQILENKNYQETSESIELNRQNQIKQQLFWDFIYENQDALDIKMNEAKETSLNKIDIHSTMPYEKSYWRMLFRLTISAFISFQFFRVLVLLLPFRKSYPHLFNVKSKYGKYKPLKIFSFIIQTCYWLFWSSYCAFTIIFYKASSLDSNEWIYYLTGLFFVIIPMEWFEIKLNWDKRPSYTYEDDYGKKVFYKNENVPKEWNSYVGGADLRKVAFLFSLFGVGAFIVFCIWTELINFKYISGLHDWIFGIVDYLTSIIISFLTYQFEF